MIRHYLLEGIVPLQIGVLFSSVLFLLRGCSGSVRCPRKGGEGSANAGACKGEFGRGWKGAWLDPVQCPCSGEAQVSLQTSSGSNWQHGCE